MTRSVKWLKKKRKKHTETIFKDRLELERNVTVNLEK